MRLDPVDARAQVVPVALFEIGRQRHGAISAGPPAGRLASLPERVAAAKCLAREIVLRQRKIAGQLAEPFTQHVRHVAAFRQLDILRRRDAQAI